MVSIVIPAYNAADSLAEAVESVRNQTLSDWELIIVNDGSGDSTALICETFARYDDRIKVTEGSHRGAYKARLEGVMAAKGEWVMFLDADDILTPDALEALLAFHNGKRDIIAGNVTLDNTIVRPNNPCGDLTPREYLNGILTGGVYVGVCAKLIRRTLFSSIAVLDHPILEVNEDVLLLVSLLSSARQAYVSNSITGYIYRGFDDNIKSRKMILANWYRLFDAMAPVVAEIGDRQTRKLFIQYRLQSLYLFPLRINGELIPQSPTLCELISDADGEALSDDYEHIVAILRSPARQRVKRVAFRITEAIKRWAKKALISTSLLFKEWLIKKIYS